MGKKTVKGEYKFFVKDGDRKMTQIRLFGYAMETEESNYLPPIPKSPPPRKDGEIIMWPSVNDMFPIPFPKETRNETVR